MKPGEARSRPRPLTGFALLVLLPLAVSACGSDAEQRSDVASAGHVHGLGVNPSDGGLYIATHAGLFRSESGTESAEPVGRQQDDALRGELMASEDAGVSWRTRVRL